jgi:hypothetical protein
MIATKTVKRKSTRIRDFFSAAPQRHPVDRPTRVELGTSMTMARRTPKGL